jgi:hypothetical protein
MTLTSTSKQHKPVAAIAVVNRITAYLPPISSSSSSSSVHEPTVAQKKQWTLMLLRMVIDMNVSFRALTECEVFRSFVQTELGWTLPSRHTLRRLLPSYHLHLVNELKAELAGVESLSITTDSTFLTRQQVPYICITGHWIDSQWQLRTAVLAVFLAEQSETADFIANSLRDVLELQLGLGKKVHCITTDEGKNFLTAADNLKDIEALRENLRCACHRVQLVVKRAIEHSDCSDLRALLDKCCVIVNQFKNGWQSKKRDVLRRKQDEYLRRLVNEVDELEDDAAHLTRVNVEQRKRNRVALDEAKSQLQIEDSSKELDDGDRAAQTQEISELSVSPSLSPHQDESDADDDEDGGDGSDSKSDDEIVDAVISQKVTDATNVKAFVNFIMRKRALIQRAATRWLTYVDVVQRCVIWREPMMQALDEISLWPRKKGRSQASDSSGVRASDPRISDDEGVILQQFLIIGRACKQVIDTLEGANHATISWLLWAHHRLVDWLDKTYRADKFHPTILAFLKQAKENAAIKFTAQVDKPAMIGALLDVRFKDLTFLSATEAGKCRDALKTAWADCKIKAGDVDPPAPKKQRVNHPDVLSDFTSDILGSLSPARGPAQTELDKYLAHPAEPRTAANPLEWWKSNASRYPNIAILARRYLAIPASSAASERLFSRLKLTATAARHGMNADTLCMLLFVSCHDQRLHS